MDSLARLLLRFVLVPLGYFAAVVVATLVIVLGSWKLGAAAAHPDTQAFAIFGFVFAAPVLLIMLLSLMWLPAAIGILISEAFAIRSFMFHACNGAVSAFIGWSLFGYVDATRVLLNEPLHWGSNLACPLPAGSLPRRGGAQPHQLYPELPPDEGACYRSWRLSSRRLQP